MEALIYEESPLAGILEGDAIPFHQAQSTPSPPAQYAPRGLPRLRHQLLSIQQKASSIVDASDDRLLERFRYTIIASQLLSDGSEQRACSPHDDSGSSITFSLRGVLLTATISFSFAWLLHWLRARRRSANSTSFSEIFLYTTIAAGLAVLFVFAARRQYLKFVRQSAIGAASGLVKESQNFDTSITATLRYIQEIEVVARGYELSHPLPPVTRLDEKHAHRQCNQLRVLAAKSLIAGISQFVHFHNQLQPMVDPTDLNTYYHIYEMSAENFTTTVNYANELSTEAQESLKQLRFLFELHNIARKFFLADLLAVRAKSSWSDVHRWRTLLQCVQTIAEDKVQASQTLQGALYHEEHPFDREPQHSSSGGLVASLLEDNLAMPEKQHSKSQLRRFESLVHGVRSLNAKVKIARDDVTSVIAMDAGEAAVSANLARHYHSLGSELRSLLVDWERGRNSMLLNVDPEARYSRPSSGIRSPASPSPSLGGVTMVDGGPAEALRLLSGDEDASGAENSGFDEEVFEAVAIPRKRMSLAFSREEKMAKLQESRRKRATLQERAETTTNMLRELQMVIKHRPTQSRPNTRVTSI